METNINPSVTGAALVLMAAASLFTMLSLSQINHIVHSDLSTYGLQFSYRWAMPYWVFSGAVFVLAWVNISIPIIAAFYILKRSRPEHVSMETLKEHRDYDTTQPEEEDGQLHLSEFAESQKDSLIPESESSGMASNRFAQDDFPPEGETTGKECAENRSGNGNRQETAYDQPKEESTPLDFEEHY